MFKIFKKRTITGKAIDAFGIDTAGAKDIANLAPPREEKPLNSVKLLPPRGANDGDKGKPPEGQPVRAVKKLSQATSDSLSGDQDILHIARLFKSRRSENNPIVIAARAFVIKEREIIATGGGRAIRSQNLAPREFWGETYRGFLRPELEVMRLCTRAIDAAVANAIDKKIGIPSDNVSKSIDSYVNAVVVKIGDKSLVINQIKKRTFAAIAEARKLADEEILKSSATASTNAGAATETTTVQKTDGTQEPAAAGRPGKVRFHIVQQHKSKLG